MKKESISSKYYHRMRMNFGSRSPYVYFGISRYFSFAERVHDASFDAHYLRCSKGTICGNDNTVLNKGLNCELKEDVIVEMLLDMDEGKLEFIIDGHKIGPI